MPNEEEKKEGSGENHDEKINIKLDEDLSEEELALQQENENFILNFKEEDYDDEEKRAKLDEALKNAKTTIAQKRHYREKFQEAIKAKAPEKPSAPKSVEKSKSAPQAENKNEEDVSVAEIVAIRQDYTWMSKDVATEIVRGAKKFGETIDDYLKRPMVKSWIDDIKAEKDVEEASISPSRRSSSAVEQRDWSTASKEDIEKMRNKIMSRGQ